MAGRIRTKEVCPKCRGKYQGEPLRCPDCLTIPRRYSSEEMIINDIGKP